jgi:NADPH:quinone reductase-like Zn-dependent oxidoreductase
MKAVRVNEWGKPVHVEETAKPAPGKGEALVRVKAASLNPIDSSVAAGNLRNMASAPKTIGTDFAGEVEAVGPGVSHVKPGDAVYGMRPMSGGTFAEYAVAKANEVAPKPRTLDFVEAAAVPLGSTAAWTTVAAAGITRGDRVLILGAGGNVGSFAAQLAREMGAHVAVSDLPEKADFLKTLGADAVIDPNHLEQAGDLDAVLNFASTDLETRAYDLLKARGRYATTVQLVAQEEAERRGIKATSIFAQPTAEQLAETARLIDAGKLKVTVLRTYPMEEAQAALDFRSATTEPGKVVLKIG